QSTNGGLSFTSPLNLSNGPSFAFSDYPVPSQGADGTIVVGWEDNTAGGDLDAVLKVSTNGGGSFGDRMDLSNHPDSACTEVFPHSGPDGTLYVIWEAYELGQREAYLRVAVGAGGSGGPPPRGHRATDFDGDGRADVALYRGATGEWFVLRSSDGGLTR